MSRSAHKAYQYWHRGQSHLAYLDSPPGRAERGYRPPRPTPTTARQKPKPRYAPKGGYMF
ncbi:MAG: hypothetical protein LBN05_08430 [Oscillospiraceae bacterium]|jgi:hypothetical protein|nr:hypothetical protein [Oscillospiraceae bacterium]